MKTAGLIIGLFTALVLVGQVVSSFFRRRIGKVFRRYHGGLGILLTALLCAHGTLLFLVVGPPRSLWHFCGTAAAAMAVLALVSGYARHRLGQNFLSWHRGLGIAAVVFAVLHRVLPLL